MEISKLTLKERSKTWVFGMERRPWGFHGSALKRQAQTAASGGKGQKHFEDEQRKHETQLNHNTVVMMEMQDTINNLKRELSVMSRQQQQQQEQQQPQPFEGPVMFTRLDSERNAKIMKRAVNEKRLDPAKYEVTFRFNSRAIHSYFAASDVSDIDVETIVTYGTFAQMAMEKMEDYTNLPTKRLGHLVNKYVHHVQMKEVEDNVRNSKDLDEEVFQVLDKMESLQNERAKRWAEHMDQMGEERLHLVSELMTTLDSIERESGIFLIKPMYSYKGQTGPEKYQGKLSRAYRPNQRGNSRSGSDYRSTSKYPSGKSTPGQHLGKENVKSPESRDESGLSGTSTHLLGDYPKPVWNQQMSTFNQDSTKYMPALPGQINTPRILELDINRMLIGQNQVSLHVPQGFVSNDRLANAANTSIRSYVTVNRPSGQPGTAYKDRPRSHTGISDAPPATPLASDIMSQKSDSASSVTHRPGSKQVHLPTEGRNSPHGSPVSRAAFSSTSPLPPIGGDTVSDNRERDSTYQSEASISPKHAEPPYPPISPPGSSLRQTPGYTTFSPQTPAQA
ncbi:hypothetical protein LSH36_28g08067 [Paralvinella palmiformis]|uniref:Uncharacterized protein n=1 Tax=Paralvinella palmiformis TaxID=53620 RepID=A0AAD9NG71_9ANNE|nr:hypothetical protein LSH36_28g08067 [Paralvinella palmiformis]